MVKIMKKIGVDILNGNLTDGFGEEAKNTDMGKNAINKHEKTRSSIFMIYKAGIIVLFAMSAFFYETEIGKGSMPLMELEIASFVLAAILIVAFTAILYHLAISATKSFKHEGVELKSMGTSDAEILVFMERMDMFFKNIMYGAIITSLIMATILFVMLYYPFGYMTGFVGLMYYLAGIILTFPQICHLQAKKRKYVEGYDPAMTLAQSKLMEKEIGKMYVGELLYPNGKVAAISSFPKRISATKQKILRLIYTALAFILVLSVLYMSSIFEDIGEIKRNIYFSTILTVDLILIFVLRYMYALLTGGDVPIRRKICNIMGE